MMIEDAAILAAWAVLLLALVAIAPRLRLPRLDRPTPRPLRLDPHEFDLDGPVIDMEPA